MAIIKSFEAAFRRKEEKGWEKIYVVVDSTTNSASTPKSTG